MIEQATVKRAIATITMMCHRMPDIGVHLERGPSYEDRRANCWIADHDGLGVFGYDIEDLAKTVVHARAQMGEEEISLEEIERSVVRLDEKGTYRILVEQAQAAQTMDRILKAGFARGAKKTEEEDNRIELSNGKVVVVTCMRKFANMIANEAAEPLCEWDERSVQMGNWLTAEIGWRAGEWLDEVPDPVREDEHEELMYFLGRRIRGECEPEDNGLTVLEEIEGGITLLLDQARTSSDTLIRCHNWAKVYDRYIGRVRTDETELTAKAIEMARKDTPAPKLNLGHAMNEARLSRASRVEIMSWRGTADIRMRIEESLHEIAGLEIIDWRSAAQLFESPPQGESAKKWRIQTSGSRSRSLTIDI